MSAAVCSNPANGQPRNVLVLETERYRYQAAISDLSNSDIVVHQNKPEQALIGVRNWIAIEAGVKPPRRRRGLGSVPGFMADNYDSLKARNYSDDEIERQPIAELIQCIADWLRTPVASTHP